MVLESRSSRATLLVIAVLALVDVAQSSAGDGTTYSSPGYSLLTVILEKVSGRSYSELLEENILMPLGMKDTFAGNNRTIRTWRPATCMVSTGWFLRISKKCPIASAPAI